MLSGLALTLTLIEKICENVPLSWINHKFKLLGVTFETVLKNIWSINYPEKLTEVKKLLNAWTRRKLTLFGRICVVKTLAISKFIHLFMTLENPPVEVISELNTLF